MKIVNTNFKSRLVGAITSSPSNHHEIFSSSKCGRMQILKWKTFTIILFKSGKVRIMGRYNGAEELPIAIETPPTLMSHSAVHSFGFSIHLFTLANYCYDNVVSFVYEPEIFPALRMSEFDPTCVNVFASGKVMLLGLKCLRRGQGIVKKLTNHLKAAKLYK
jgi:TATA-box binding protein (TBP) (component of TFIID and TFIIIB)